MQYVAVVGGYKNTRSYYEPNGSRLLVFKLDGTAKLPAPPAFTPPPLDPPANFGTPEQLAQGEANYDRYCGACHGADGQARAFFPDLRFSPALNAQDAFDAIVLRGLLRDKGMVSFAGALQAQDTAAIRAYVTSRANALKTQRSKGKN